VLHGDKTLSVREKRRRRRKKSISPLTDLVPRRVNTEPSPRCWRANIVLFLLHTLQTGEAFGNQRSFGRFKSERDSVSRIELVCPLCHGSRHTRSGLQLCFLFPFSCFLTPSVITLLLPSSPPRILNLFPVWLTLPLTLRLPPLLSASPLFSPPPLLSVPLLRRDPFPGFLMRAVRNDRLQDEVDRIPRRA